jgi:hypothetical protein
MQQEISGLKAEIDALKIRLDSAEKSNFALHSKLADTEGASLPSSLKLTDHFLKHQL